MHSVVTAWRAHGASPDLDRVKSAIVKFQTEMTQDDKRLAVLLASSYRVDPRKNRDYLLGLIKKFRQNGKETKGNSLSTTKLTARSRQSLSTAQASATP